MKKLAMLFGALIIAVPAIAAESTAAQGTTEWARVGSVPYDILWLASVMSMFIWMGCLMFGKRDGAGFFAFLAFVTAFVAALVVAIGTNIVSTPSTYRITFIFTALAAVVSFLTALATEDRARTTSSPLLVHCGLMIVALLPLHPS